MSWLHDPQRASCLVCLRSFLRSLFWRTLVIWVYEVSVGVVLGARVDAAFEAGSSWVGDVARPGGGSSIGWLDRCVLDGRLGDGGIR